MSDEYPDSDFPWSFYFNGEVMPKWGACWGMAGVANFLQLERDADQDVGHRDVYIIYYRKVQRHLSELIITDRDLTQLWMKPSKI